MPLDLTFNSGTPAAPFGTQEHFAFCENVPLECRFSYAEWQGQSRQSNKTPWSTSSTWCPLDLEKGRQALQRTESPKILREKRLRRGDQTASATGQPR